LGHSIYIYIYIS